MGMLSWYVTSHSGRLSLLSSVGREMSTDQRAVAVLCRWEGNRRSSITLAILYRLSGVSICWLSSLRNVQAYTSVKNMAPFTFYSLYFEFPCCFDIVDWAAGKTCASVISVDFDLVDRSNLKLLQNRRPAVE